MDPPLTPPSVSILMTVRNAVATIETSVASLRKLDYPRNRLEIVIVDGGSTDGTRNVLDRMASAGGIVVLDEPGNIPRGRNAGLRRAKGEYVAFTDADVAVPPEWLRHLAGGLVNGVAGIGGPTSSARDDLLSRAIACLPVHGPSLEEVPLLGPPRFARPFETGHWVYASVTRNALYRREALEAIGGFDERFDRTEDVELNARLLGMGHRLAYTPSAPVFHHHRPSLGAFLGQQWGYAVWQAAANRVHPGLAHWKHRLPTLALLVFAVALALSTLSPVFGGLAGALAAVIGLTSLGYGLRCAVVKGDPLLLPVIPVLTIGWMLAWAAGYPRGALLSRLRTGNPS